jgi:hypothetical protein
MKYLITARPGTTPIPMQQGAQLLQASKGWMQGKIADGTIDFIYNFFGGGGFVVSNADSNEEVLANLLEYPLYAFFTWEVTPLLDFDVSLDQYVAFYENMASMMD